jgi:hypothetical protein
MKTFRVRGDRFPVLRAPAGAGCARASARVLVAVAAAALVLVASPGPARAQIPVPATPVTIDGPSADIVGLSGMSLARDGTGGLVYLKQVVGTPHVFVSRLVNGAFQAPEQVDGGLIGGSSQPVIAAGNGGLLVIAFVNGGQLYVVVRSNASAAYVGPLALANAASNPAIAMTNFGKTYLAFTAASATGQDVRAAYYYNGAWSLAPTALNAFPGDTAGTDTGRPAVAAATDGVGIVTWGEGGHVYTRRVWGASPSVVYEQADVPTYRGATEVTADEPVLSVGGDSSYVVVAFHEVFARVTQQQSRVFSRLLQGPQFNGVSAADGVTGSGPGGAVQPTTVMGEFGRGLVTAVQDDSGDVYAQLLGVDGFALSTIRIDAQQNAALPQVASAMAGQSAELVAWQQNPGAGVPPEIRLRYSEDALSFGPELVLSSPALGPANAASGLAAAGDFNGNAAVAWVQGSADSAQIVAEQLYQPPSAFAATTKFRYARSPRPVLSWSQSRDHWGPVRYSVTIDQSQVYQTSATSLLVPGILPNGLHSWVVTASNPAGQRVSTRAAKVWVDTVPPVVHVTVTGTRRVGKVVRMFVTTSDSPPPVSPASASGTASVTIRWGEGKSLRIQHFSTHVFTRPGHYKLTILATDRAGNKTTVVRDIKIAPKPKPKPKKKKKKKGKHK